MWAAYRTSSGEGWRLHETRVQSTRLRGQARGLRATDVGGGRLIRWTGFGLVAVLAVGCAARRPLPLDFGEPRGPVAENALHVEWTGVGAFVIRHDDVAILTDPYWSHYPLGRLAFGSILNRSMLGSKDESRVLGRAMAALEGCR